VTKLGLKTFLFQSFLGFQVVEKRRDTKIVSHLDSFLIKNNEMMW